MPSRRRQRSGRVVSCKGNYGDIVLVPSAVGWLETCDDVIGDYGGNHDLYIRKDECHGSQFVYLQEGKRLTYERPGAPTAFYTVNLNPEISGEPSAKSYAARLAAQSGPLTPSINLPLSVFELRDVPRMLKHAGNLLHGLKEPSKLNPVMEAASANLAWKFGWDPLISDLGKLLKLADSTKRIQRNLKAAHSTKGLRRRINLGSNSQSFTEPKFVLHSTWGQQHRVLVTGIKISKTWGTIRWVVRDPSRYGKEPTFNESLRVALGLNAGMIPITVWKALPWTWMIDWFTDISNVLQANYNTIYYKPSHACVMRESVGTFYHPPIDMIDGDPQNYITAGFRTNVVKRRTPVAITGTNTLSTLRVPMWDSYKLSVLGSLAVLKGRR